MGQLWNRGFFRRARIAGWHEAVGRSTRVSWYFAFLTSPVTMKPSVGQLVFRGFSVPLEWPVAMKSSVGQLVFRRILRLSRGRAVPSLITAGTTGHRRSTPGTRRASAAGKKVTAATARALLKREVSPPLKGFQSKSGNTFDARLKLENGVVRFDFEA